MQALENPLPAGLVKQGADVFYAQDPLVLVTPARIAWLKAQAAASPRKRSRLCAHDQPAATVHEMVIVHHRDVYVRPHRHARKSESFHRIEGDAWIVLFAADGGVDRVLELDGGADAPILVRIPAGVFHSFIIRSEWLVFHETTAGPFERAEMEFAAWSPEASDHGAVALFEAELERRCAARLQRG